MRGRYNSTEIPGISPSTLNAHLQIHHRRINWWSNLATLKVDVLEIFCIKRAIMAMAIPPTSHQCVPWGSSKRGDILWLNFDKERNQFWESSSIIKGEKEKGMYVLSSSSLFFLFSMDVFLPFWEKGIQILYYCERGQAPQGYFITSLLHGSLM